MSIQKWSERIWVVRLNDDPAFTEDLDHLADQVLAPDRMPHLVLDFSSVVHLCSSNLSALLRLRKALLDRKSQLRLTAPGDAVWAVFLTTGLDKVFQFSHDTTTALAELQIGS
ncbi:MAG: STAS domain-containing protein [Phycisphaerales bacterium]